jgi:hypothetical protein
MNNGAQGKKTKKANAGEGREEAGGKKGTQAVVSAKHVVKTDNGCLTRQQTMRFGKE